MGGDHEERPAERRLPTLVTLALLAAGLAAAVPSTADHHGLATVHSETVDRSGAFGASVDLAEPGGIEFVLNGYGELTSTPISLGAAFYEGDGDYIGMIAVTAHLSPDRLHVTVSPEGALATNDAASSDDVFAEGDLAALGGLELVLERTDDGSGAEAEEQPTISGFTVLHGRDAGTHQAIVWLGEAERTELEIQTDASLDGIATRAGTSHVVGDQDLDDAVVDVQAQESFLAGSIPLEGTRSLGAKAMVDAHETIDVHQELRGFWGLAERKGACTTDGCLGPTDVSRTCEAAIDVSCGPSRISWTNGTAEGHDRRIYSFLGTGQGTYRFQVDHKADAYEAGLAGAEWKENHSYLTVADVALPSG